MIPGAIRRLTGSTAGETPVSDGLSRASFVAAVQALFAWFATRVDWLGDGDLVVLIPVTTVIGGVAWGVWDAIDKRLLARRAEHFDQEAGDGITPGDGL